MIKKAETPENTADPVDGKQKEEDPTAINMEAKEEEASKNRNTGKYSIFLEASSRKYCMESGAYRQPELPTF